MTCTIEAKLGRHERKNAVMIEYIHDCICPLCGGNNVYMLNVYDNPAAYRVGRGRVGSVNGGEPVAILCLYDYCKHNAGALVLDDAKAIHGTKIVAVFEESGDMSVFVENYERLMIEARK